MATNIKARRKLSDLFQEGVEIRFGRDADGKPVGKIGPFLDSMGERAPCPDDEVAMYITPPNPLQREEALREGQARRARALVRAKRDENSEEHLTIMAFLADMDDSTLIDYVILSDTGERRAEAEREVLALDEWKDMVSYQDAMRQFDEILKTDPDSLDSNEEWQALLELDEKYAMQISERENELRLAQQEVLRMLPRVEIEKKALENRAELAASQAFINEYERQMKYFAVRDVDNTSNLYFESAADLASQHDEILKTVGEALLPFISDAGEAKNSQGAAPGSGSSELPSEQETSEPSTPQERSA